MKRLLTITVLIVLAVSAANSASGVVTFSLKELKNELKKDSSEEGNAALAKRVLRYGVSFRYTLKRENKLRGWGANDTLISAIFQSITDEANEKKLYREFMENRDSEDRETRKAALEKGNLYLSRYGENERFAENVAKVKAEKKFLDCEFDPSLGC